MAGWTPDEVGRMTIEQIACYGSAKAPDETARVLETFEDFSEEMARIEAEDRAWYQ